MAAFDAIIVGGGLVGSALAYGMARAGANVALVDEGDGAVRASRGNFGLVAVQLKGIGNPAYQRWSRLAADTWAEFAAELGERTGIDVAFRRAGSLIACVNEQEWNLRAAQMAQLRREAGAFGFDYRMLELAEARKLLPELGPGIVGGSYTPYDGECSPLRLLRALHAAVVGLGGRYVAHSPVRRLSSTHGAFTVPTAVGDVSAPIVVLAAGLGVRALATLVGLDAPVWPQRGQIIATERTRPMMKLQMGGIRQTAEGSFMIGATREDAGLDDRTTAIGLNAMARRAVTILPFLAGLGVVRTWAAFRVMTPDEYPIYQQSVAHPGAFVATCHSGVTLASVHALKVAPALLAGSVPAELACFSDRRFHVQTAA